MSQRAPPPQSDSSAAADERLSEHDSAGDPPAATTARIPDMRALQGRDSADTSTQGAANESASSQRGAPVSVSDRPVAAPSKPKSEQERPPQSDSSAAADRPVSVFERLSEHDSAGDPTR